MTHETVGAARTAQGNNHFMAHSHDRTLLAKFGFDDVDRRNEKHDLACRYLVEDEQAAALAASLFPIAPN